MSDADEPPDTDADPPQGVEVARITIVKTFDADADGGAAVWTTYSDGLTLIDALGMLAFAQATTFHNYRGDE